MPLMTEVFVLKEESLRAWEMMGLDAKYKAHLEQQLSRWRMDPRLALPYAVLSAGGMDGDRIALSMLSTSPEFRKALVRLGNEFMKRVHGGDFAAKNELSKRISAEFGEGPPAYDKGEVFADAGEGWRWVKLDRSCRGWEGHLMQHCGSGVGDMYSLRDPQGKPHVTADVVTDPEGVDDGPLHHSRGVAQLRGKQNKSPDRKYWPMIKRFISALPARDREIGDPEVDADLIYYVNG